MSYSAIARPEANEYAPDYGTYITLVPDGNIVEILEQQLEKTLALFATLSEEKGNFRYAPEKWSIKQLVGHISDAERIFAYRALRFARNDQHPLESFEQDDYIANADFDSCRLSDLVTEFKYVRMSNIYLLRHLTSEAWLRRGVANDNEISVRALAYSLAGHELHHRNILVERYL